LSLARRATAEALGAALLVAAVVGSGIMAQRLFGPATGLALLANTVATGAALLAILLALEPLSGAHLNPAVTLAFAWRRSFAWRDVPAYLAAQCAGAVAGSALANAMFGLPLLSAAQRVRSGGGQWLGEFVATFGLLAVIWACGRRPERSPFAVAAYITGAYWFTSSTSFANPAVTLARSLSDTFAGIRPADVGPFVVAQLAGASAATVLFAWFAHGAAEPAAALAAPALVPGTPR
jgi:glycerol uptake facilitator-like aquaporin